MEKEPTMAGTRRTWAPINTTHKLAGALLTAVALAVVCSPSEAGNFYSDFNSGQPPGTWLFGNAYVDTKGGVKDSGVLKLTTAYEYGTTGYLLVDALDGGDAVSSLSASFRLKIGNGDGADGFSFNFAPDLPEAAFRDAEEGGGSGLTVSFDTFDNGGGEAPGIDVKAGGITIAATRGNLELFRTGDYLEVSLELSELGRLNLFLGGQPVINSLFVPLLPFAGRFGLAARTGDLSDDHWVDDLSIKTSTKLPEFPTVRSASPVGNGVRGDALINLLVLDGQVTQVKPGTVKLMLNHQPVAPMVSSGGGIITVSYQPPSLLLPGTSNVVLLVYRDTSDQEYSFCFGFNVAPYLGPTGNIYEMVLAPEGITWLEAKVKAEQRTYLGQHGHLATIKSQAEDWYVDYLRQMLAPISANGRTWVGGFQEPFDCPADQNWRWVNDEGPIPGVNGTEVYANWAGGEPNDFYGWATENYLSIGHWGGWNDEGWVQSDDGGKLFAYLVEYEAPAVTIDIRPGSDPNPVNLGANGRLPVAILSSKTFDVSCLDRTSITFGYSGYEATPVKLALEDVNGDKRMDLLCHFNTQDAAFSCESTYGVLRARTLAGWQVTATDNIRPQPCAPFRMQVSAMQDVQGVTDIYPQIYSIGRNCELPVVSPHIQFKSTDLLGRTQWVANEHDVPLELTASNSCTANLQYAGLLRHESFEVKAQVRSCLGNDMLVLRAEGTVLLRPDLAIVDVAAPQQVYQGMVVNIPAVVSERNGDLGAVCWLYLMEDGTVLDQAIGWVGPYGAASFMFTTQFDAPGVHKLSIWVAQATPADYDNSNNAREFSLEVVPQPAYYDAYYNHHQQEYSREYDYPWSQRGTNYSRANQEWLSQSLSIPFPLAFPLDRLSILTFADGLPVDNYDFVDLKPDYSDPAGRINQVFRELAEGFNFYLTSYDMDWYRYTSFQMYRYAVDNLYYSQNHDYIWNTDKETLEQKKYGLHLNGKSTIATRVIIESGKAVVGGSVTIPLSTSSYDYTNVLYEDPATGAYDREHSKGSDTSGYSLGYVTP